jgi:Uma2 family endonuclease
MRSAELLEKRRYTLKEFMELDLEDGARAELIGGEICMMSSSTSVHQRVVSILRRQAHIPGALHGRAGAEIP